MRASAASRKVAGSECGSAKARLPPSVPAAADADVGDAGAPSPPAPASPRARAAERSIARWVTPPPITSASSVGLQPRQLGDALDVDRRGRSRRTRASSPAAARCRPRRARRRRRAAPSARPPPPAWPGCGSRRAAASRGEPRSPADSDPSAASRPSPMPTAHAEVGHPAAERGERDHGRERSRRRPHVAQPDEALLQLAVAGRELTP